MTIESEESALVVFDIDNTLLKSIQHFGSVAWGEYVIKDLEKKGISKREAIEIESIFWKTVQPYIKVQAVDPDTQSIIRAIQEKGIPVICLTARLPEELPNTHRQLQSIGLDFSKTHLLPGTMHSLHLTPDTLYSHGILFATQRYQKSEVLISFLREAGLNPQKILFIDDKRGHVEDVVNTLSDIGIKCIGFRFGGADKDASQFNPLIADVQWRTFPLMLSDEEAYALLKRVMRSSNIDPNF